MSVKNLKNLHRVLNGQNNLNAPAFKKPGAFSVSSRQYLKNNNAPIDKALSFSYYCFVSKIG